ncbi:MAG: arginase family protein [Alphaproteobacteria bacterium]
MAKTQPENQPSMLNRTMISPYFLDQPMAGLVAILEAGGYAGATINQPALPGTTPMAAMAAVHAPLRDFVTRAVQTGQRPVSLAGDCCTTIAVLAGLQRAGIDPVLIWFDAHGDFNNFETSPSGFLGGMPLAMLAGRGDQTMMQAMAATPLDEARIILTDARDLDEGEAQALAASRVTHLPDITQLLTHALPDRPVYIHFDTDIITTAEMPAQNYPVGGGPSAELVQTVFRHLEDTCKIAAISLSSWNPALDTDGACAKVGLATLAALDGPQN